MKKGEKRPARKKRASRPERNPHDPEGFARSGMASEGVAADEAETMASSGDADASFQEVAAGTATGVGLDRGGSTGTGGLAAGEDLDVVAEGDYWRENLRREPFRESETSYEHGVEFLRETSADDEEEG